MWHMQCCFLRPLLFLLCANVFLNCTGKLSVPSFKDDAVMFLRDLPSLAPGLRSYNHRRFVKRVQTAFFAVQRCSSCYGIPPLLSLADPYYKLLGIHELGNIIIYKFQYSVLHVSCFVQLNKVQFCAASSTLKSEWQQRGEMLHLVTIVAKVMDLPVNNLF